jgi:hypothetical protein
VNGVEIQGLLKRRLEEAALFLEGSTGDQPVRSRGSQVPGGA